MNGSLGEFDLISRLTAGLPRSEAVLVGVGDDAAILNWDTGYQVLATCDAQVEGQHFLRSYIAPEQLGRRALTVNVSDVAAMGGEPLFALVSLLLTPDVEPEWLEQLYAGLRAEARRYGVSIVGGNVAATDASFTVDITLLGRVSAGKAILRSGAQPGDRIYVTGHPGMAAAGLLTLQYPRQVEDHTFQTIVSDVQSALLTPRARVAEGRALAATDGVAAMIDISDGLAADLGHVCACSQVGALVERGTLPIDMATRVVAEAYGRDATDLALYGGEDYELLFAVHPANEARVIEAINSAGSSISAIGWITEPTNGLYLLEGDNSRVKLEPRGWDHLRNRAQQTAGREQPGGGANT